MKTKICSRCASTHSPIWRKHPVDGKQICNACGLFLKNHGSDRPSYLIDRLKVQQEKRRFKEKPRKGPCYNCGATESCFWRKDADSRQLCNACGLYLRYKGAPRPLEFAERHHHRQLSSESYDNITFHMGHNTPSMASNPAMSPSSSFSSSESTSLDAGDEYKQSTLLLTSEYPLSSSRQESRALAFELVALSQSRNKPLHPSVSASPRIDNNRIDLADLELTRNAYQATNRLPGFRQFLGGLGFHC